MPVSPDAGSAKHQRVVDYIVEHLAGRGVRHIFGVDGANIEDLYDAAHTCPELTAVVAKHEFSAAAMADAYSRAGTGLGVVAATSGGGALNTVPGLGESLASRVPVVALIGQTATTADGAGSFQDTSGLGGSLDAVALFSAVSVFCERVTTPDDIRTALPAAVTAATSRRGPAVLLLPKDIQQAPVAHHTRESAESVHRHTDDPAAVIEVLRNTGGPVSIIAGDQVAHDDARSELAALAQALQAHTATVPDAKDVVTDALGVAGVMGHPAVRKAIADSAVCLLIGTRLPLMARGGLEDALASVQLVSIGSAPPYLPAIHVDTDDLKATLAHVVAGIPATTTAPPERHDSELAPPPLDGPGVRYRDAMRTLDTLLPNDADIVVDAGNIGAAAIHWLPARRDGHFLVALGMGGMGYSFGAGIGTAFACGRRTVVIAGDGSFYMHGMEIHTAIQHRLPVTFVLFDNQAHAMCVTREQMFYGGQYSFNRFGPSRLGVGLAAMFPGLPAVDVADAAELAAALPAALAVDGPSVIAVQCSADEIPPFTAFLATDSKDNS